jgi:type II secretory pathway pseudopilin PulG
MMVLAHTKLDRPSHRMAFTLVEAVVSVLIVGTLLVAALSTVGASRLSQFKTSQASRGQLLGESLMAEILRQEYLDPDGNAVFGLESGESTTTREGFDDVDDYHKWSSSPPVNKDGAEITGLPDWQRNVTIEWVDPMDPKEVKSSETNAKRVTVTVANGNIKVASLTAIRTNSGL